MQVRDAMTPECKCIRTHDSLREAATLMRDCDIGMLLVEDAQGGFGVITDRDIAVRGVAEAASPDEPVERFMSRGVISCGLNAELQEAAHLMEQEQVRRLLVTDEKGRPCGVLAQADLARVSGRSELIGELLQEISQPRDGG
jgi:CBS domain-containing protein